MSASPGAVEPRTFFPLVDQLRGVAAVLVVYAHLVGNFLDDRHRSWPPKSALDVVLRDPLHSELNFGWLAVVFFFFISGFVVTHAAFREGAGPFAIRRVLRIYPPLIAMVIVVTVLAWAGIATWGVVTAPSPLEALASATLANWALAWGPQLILVAWTLMVEVLFYAAVLAARPLLLRMPWLAPLTILALIAALVGLLGQPVTGVLRYLSFVPIPVAGMTIYLLYTRRIRSWAGALLLAGAWLTLVLAQHRTNPQLADPAASYLSDVAIGGLVFGLVLLLEGRLKPFRALTVLANRSYSIYLTHLTAGGTVLALWVDVAHLPYTPGLLIALVVTAVATELLHRLVERPSQRLGRRISIRAAG